MVIDISHQLAGQTVTLLIERIDFAMVRNNQTPSQLPKADERWVNIAFQG